MVAKSLLIKGVGGLAAVGGVLGGGFLLKEQFSKEKPKALMEKLGLNCGDLKNIGEQGVQCSISKINVRRGETTFELANIVSSSGKINVYKDNGYSQGFKFAIEGTDISVNNNNNKLEEFETYEALRENKGYILSRKKKSWEEKRRILGLSDGCNFPENTSPTTCQITQENINNINFEGKGSSAISGAGTLKIETSTDANTFPHGFKFTLTSSSDITIGEITKFKNGKETELKIKKTNSKTLTLEKAWNLDTLSNIVGLTCSNNICTIKNNGLSVKQENDSQLNLTSSDSNQGQIKVVNDDTYEYGLKFQMENGNINFDNSTGTISLLEEFDTYEIKKDTEENWYLTRKEKGMDRKKTLLSLPQGCDLPSSDDQTSCDLDTEKINQIKFDGKGSHSITLENSQSPKLKIDKTTDDNFPMGYRFVLESEKDLNVTSSLTVKANIPTDFKIKRETGGGISLERAWDVVSLGKKIGITCKTDPKECTLGATISVRESDSNLSENAKVSGTDKKLIYEDNKEGYNQGFKFNVKDADIDLSGGGTNGGGSPVTKIKKCEDTDSQEISYEIVEKRSTISTNKIWYLSRKWSNVSEE